MASLNYSQNLPNELIKNYRSRIGLTQSQFALEMGFTSRRMVQYWESGNSLPKPDNLRKLIATLFRLKAFSIGKELQESEALWQAVKFAAEDNYQKMVVFPNFDVAWFNALYQPPLPPTSKLKATEQTRAIHNLPIVKTGLIGRKVALDEVFKLLKTSRLVTLCGMGGIGKTRLALEVAWTILDQAQSSTEVWFIELATLQKPEQLVQMIAATLNLTEINGLSSEIVLLNYLQQRQLLLVLDNCEHLIESCARWVDYLLKHCPHLQILTTSREIFRLSNELTFTVLPLELPDPHPDLSLEKLAACEAVHLFIECAKVANPDFRLNQQNVKAIVSICRQLEGIPLSLELAAARMRVLTEQQIEQRLNDRFRLLTKGNRATMSRHQTLLALIDWSFDLLDEKEQLLLCRASVFAGGWKLDAFEQICNSGRIAKDEILDLLTNLVNKSLVITKEAGEEKRYNLLETLREYGKIKLPELDHPSEVQTRHLSYYLHLAESLESKFMGTEQGEALAILKNELDNFRVGLEWAIQQEEAELALRLATALHQLWALHGHFREGYFYLKRALSLSKAVEPRVRAKALLQLGRLAYRQGDYAEAWQQSHESVTILRNLDDKQGIHWPLFTMGVSATMQGNYLEGCQYLEESLVLSRAANDKLAIATCLCMRGITAALMGQFTELPIYIQESQDLTVEFGNKWSTLMALSLFGNVAMVQSNYTEVERSRQESLSRSHQTWVKWLYAYWLGLAGWLASHQGHFLEARAICQESLALRQEIEDKWGIAYTLNILGDMALIQGDYATAQNYGEKSLVVCQEIKAKWQMSWALNILGECAFAQEKYPEAWGYTQEGRALRQETGDIVGTALHLHSLGKIATAQQRYSEAQHYYEESLTLKQQHGMKRDIAISLCGLVHLFLIAENPKGQQITHTTSGLEQLARLYGTIPALLLTHRNTLPRLEKGYYENGLELIRLRLGDATFQVAFEEGRAMPFEKVIEDALMSFAQ
ncbi:MAG: tetratricopeptide repeat protein [Chloroflexota bacterium]